MGWELRRGRPYYYRKRRVNGRVVSEYLGAGLLGVVGSAFDAEDRQERAAAEAAWRAERERLDAAEAELAGFCRAVEEAARAALAAAGCHRHKGTWRRRRGMGEVVFRIEITPEEQKLLPVIRRARDGDEAAVAELRRALAPEAFVRVAGGHIAGGLIQAIAARIAGEDMLQREGLRARVRQLVKDLAGPDPTPLEELLAERVGVCWLDACQADWRCAAADGESFRAADYHERRRDRAHRRFLAACTALATARRLAGPGVAVRVTQAVTVHQAPAEATPPVGPGVAEILAARGAD